MPLKPITLLAALAGLFLSLVIIVGPYPTRAQQAPAKGVQVRMQAPTDKAVDFPAAELQRIYQEMDEQKLPTVRLIEGGKHNVNIRRIGGSETALIHPKTTDVYVVTEGSGTLVTGGQIVNGRIVGGVDRIINVGDVVYIPAGVTHAITETKHITWLNIRFDTRE